MGQGNVEKTHFGIQHDGACFEYASSSCELAEFCVPAPVIDPFLDGFQHDMAFCPAVRQSEHLHKIRLTCIVGLCPSHVVLSVVEVANLSRNSRMAQADAQDLSLCP